MWCESWIDDGLGETEFDLELVPSSRWGGVAPGAPALKRCMRAWVGLVLELISYTRNGEKVFAGELTFSK